MNKSFYTFSIYLLGITVVTGLIQAIFYYQAYSQNSFIVWFVAVHILSFISSVLLLKYYAYKKYWPVFFIGLIALFADVSYGLATYQALTLKGTYNLPVHIFSLCTGIGYAAALMFSETAKRIWLRFVGFFLLTHGAALLLITIAGPGIGNNKAAVVARFFSFAVCIIPVLFMMNFRSEIREMEATPSVNQ